MRIPRWVRGWATLGRPSRGRHALGPAVTGIPHASLPVLQSWGLPARVEPEPQHAQPEPVHLAASWVREDYTWPVDVLPAELGPGPAADLSVPEHLPAQAVPPREAGQMPWLQEHEEPVEAASAPAASSRDLLASFAVALASDQAEPPAVAAPRLVAPPAEPWPVDQEPDGGAGQQHGRIQLGFRDGSSTTLDPDSEQAAALEELALLLTLHSDS